MHATSAARARGPVAHGDRRGSALILVIVMTVALGALALSAIYIGSSATMVTRSHEKEHDYRYAAEAALAMGRSRLSTDAAISLHDSLPTQLLSSATLRDASGASIPGVDVNLWVARTGSKTGQHGLYASVIAEARDPSGGARYVRRLELMEENFARFLDWSDKPVNGYYATGEVMNGPVWSNGDIQVGGARFKDTVATAGVIKHVKSGTVFDVPPQQRLKKMTLPSLARLGRLEPYAEGANLAFDAPTNGDPTTARLRIEFVWWDLDGDGTAVDDPEEGFIRVYRGKTDKKVRADYYNGTWDDQCGDWHFVDGVKRFFPVSAHEEAGWMQSLLEKVSKAPGAAPGRRNWQDDGFKDTDALEDHLDASREAIMRAGRTSNSGTAYPSKRYTSSHTPRCFPAGDPHLAAVERGSTYSTAARHIGGSDTTFTPKNADGEWLPWAGAAVPWSSFTNPPPASMQPYLHPLDRGLNSGAKGVIFVDGTVAMSGVLNGRVTVYATGYATFVDDLRYSVDPSSDDSDDMLGVISARDVTIADNAINTPQDPKDGGDDGNTWMDDDTHFTLHGVILALGTFKPERYDKGPTDMSVCNGVVIGKGCLYQVGGAIVNVREVTFSSTMRGYMEARDYDRRMARQSPPYFPTTGRYFDNRFYEVDPHGFDITTYLQRIGQSGS
ncbi:MAG TPA: pilus assembly PilX N-terminal domain-containing protein [Gemmatimonadales bacterium]